MSTTDKPAAVLYAHVRRSLSDGSERRALDEGRAWAAAHGIELVDVITDSFSTAAPAGRDGWSRVRQLVETGTVDTVITRWRSCVALDEIDRRRETAWLTEHGARLIYTWAPLRGVSS